MEDRKYPYIGITKDTGLKVVFIKPRTGFIITSSRNYSYGNYYIDWAEGEFIPENKDLEKYSCVVVETIEDLERVEEELGKERGEYFIYYYKRKYNFPVLIWLDGGCIQHNSEGGECHRVLFKDYAIWGKDKKKAREILNITTTVEMTLEEICKELGKNIKIVKKTQ